MLISVVSNKISQQDKDRTSQESPSTLTTHTRNTNDQIHPLHQREDTHYMECLIRFPSI